jgi:ABC-type dipeptide/oligopeptide/nickel transport system ATPase component
LKKGILIGITGASGSGKTLVAENIYKQLGSENVVIMEEDSYYRDLSDIPFDERSGSPIRFMIIPPTAAKTKPKRWVLTGLWCWKEFLF